MRPNDPVLRSLFQEPQGTEEVKHKPAMTCRINRLVIREDLVILHISGRIAGQDVNMLRALVEQERSAVAIDLRDVLLVDREAVQLLAVRESNGDELRNCPAYIREWVTRERVDTNAAGVTNKRKGRS
jgi:hypothetical protein